MTNSCVKNFQIKTKYIKEIAELLTKINDNAEVKYDNTVKAFIDEANELREKFKNYTPERSAKLLASMKCFLCANNIKESDGFQDVFEGFESIFNNKTTKTFAKCSLDIKKLLYSCKKRTFMGRVLYILEDAEKDKILQVEKEIINSFERKSDIKKFKISKLVNLLNPSKAAIKYSVRYTSKYQQVGKNELVKQLLPAHFKRYSIIKSKEFFEMLSVHNYNEKQIATLTQKHNTEMQKIEEEYSYLMQNSDELDIRIISSAEATIYPLISFTAGDKSHEKMLKMEIPNALWFNPAISREKMTLEEFIDGAQHSFDDVYYMPKEVKTKISQE